MCAKKWFGAGNNKLWHKLNDLHVQVVICLRLKCQMKQSIFWQLWIFVGNFGR